MEISDFIVYRFEQEQKIENAYKRALQYATLSLPFTVNRMNFNDLSKRFNNVVKGKFSEFVFEDFLLANGCNADFDSGATPFWLNDNYDFGLKGYEWDCKNNFINQPISAFSESDFLSLPALIPDRHDNDQFNRWIKSGNPKNAFVFTFIEKGKVQTFDLSSAQINLFSRAIKYYKGRTVKEEPFEKEVFFDEFKLSNLMTVIQPKPVDMLVGPMLTWQQKDVFEKCAPQVFGNNLIKTRITNRVAPCINLPSFKDFIREF